jgi:hypothetical protein
LLDPGRLLAERGCDDPNIRSIRLTTLEGIDPGKLRRLPRQAVALADDPTIPPVSKVKRAKWPVLDLFAAALAEKSKRSAAEFFRSLKPICQRNIRCGLRRRDSSKPRSAGYGKPWPR